MMARVHCKGQRMLNINNVVELDDKKLKKQLSSEIRSLRMFKI
jgi:hypothetical protein